MTQCYQNSFEFPRVCRRVVEARFDGGEITSNGGALLLRQADRYSGLTQAVADALSDPRADPLRPPAELPPRRRVAADRHTALPCVLARVAHQRRQIAAGPHRSELSGT